MSDTSGCDYSCQRKQNLEKLKRLYNSELNKYTTEYNNYLTAKYSGNSSQITNADNVLKPKVEAINSSLNTILSEIKKNIEYTNTLIEKQKREIDLKNNLINEKNQVLDKQEKYFSTKDNELVSKLEQVNFSKKRNNYRKFMIIILVFLNIAVLAVLYKLVLKK